MTNKELAESILRQYGLTNLEDLRDLLISRWQNHAKTLEHYESEIQALKYKSDQEAYLMDDLNKELDVVFEELNTEEAAS